MPVLKNPRHERYAQELAKGKTLDEAYKLAGYSPNRGNATRLKANESVLSRVAEIQGRAAKRAEVTLTSLTEELEEARLIAVEKKQSAGAVSATMGKAKLHGKIIDRVSNVDLSHLTTDELDTVIGILERAEARRSEPSAAQDISGIQGGEAQTHH